MEFVILHKKKRGAQVGHGAGELRHKLARFRKARHIGCKWVSIWNREPPFFPDRQIKGRTILYPHQTFPIGKYYLYIVRL